MKMTIRFTLGTPLLAPQRGQVWVLDRWLAGAAALSRFPSTMTQRHPHMSDWVGEEDLDIPLATDEETKVYAATQATFPLGGRMSEHRRTKKVITDVWPLVKSGKNAGKGVTNFMSSGIFKASYFVIPVCEVPIIEFVADITNQERLKTLLNILWTNGVGGDRTRGYGMVAKITVAPVTGAAEGGSCVWDIHGWPTRPIPWQALSSDRKALCHQGLANRTLQLLPQRVVSPAWTAKNQTLCVLPTHEWPTGDAFDNESEDGATGSLSQ